jgi:hypothetical protein
LDAIATTAEMVRIRYPTKFEAGGIIRKRISAVIIQDSTLIYAFRIFENNIFEIRHTNTKYINDAKSSNPSKFNTFMNANAMAIALIKSNP